VTDNHSTTNTEFHVQTFIGKSHHTQKTGN